MSRVRVDGVRTRREPLIYAQVLFVVAAAVAAYDGLGGMRRYNEGGVSSSLHTAAQRGEWKGRAADAQPAQGLRAQVAVERGLATGAPRAPQRLVVLVPLQRLARSQIDQAGEDVTKGRRRR